MHIIRTLLLYIQKKNVKKSNKTQLFSQQNSMSTTSFGDVAVKT